MSPIDDLERSSSLRNWRRVALIVAISVVFTGCTEDAPLADSASLDPVTTELASDDSIANEQDDSSDGDDLETPEGWTVPPPLSERELAAHPLLRDMSPLDTSGPWSEFSTQIGVSRYRLVDEAGSPVSSGDSRFADSTMTMWAFHGSVVPVVYWVAATRSVEDPELGFQSTCDEALGFLFPGTIRDFRFSGEGDPGIYEDRYFFGDSFCETDDLSILPFLSADFSIEVRGDRSLRIIGDNDTVWFMEWIALES